MAVNRKLFVARRYIRWLEAGTDAPSAEYLAGLESAGELIKPIATLQELSKTPRWDGRTVYLAGSGRKLVWHANRWRICTDSAPAR